VCSCEEICDSNNNNNKVNSNSNEEASPVCGSDHVTYKNACSLKEAACRKQENITVIAELECGELRL
jgi:hypothetical protein